MMTLENIKENLCYNDSRNPDSTIDIETTERNIVDKECYCDNCFRGKTILAEELLKYYHMVNPKP